MASKKRKSPRLHKVRSHTRLGRSVRSFWRGKGQPKVRIHKVKLPKYKVGDIVLGTNGVIARIEKVKKDGYEVKSLDGMSKWNFWDKIIKHKLTKTQLTNIMRERKRKAKRLIQKYEKVGLISHESRKRFLQSILKNGIRVGTRGVLSMPFNGTPFPKYGMFSEVEVTKDRIRYSKSSGGKGQPDSIYVIMERPKYVHLLLAENLKKNPKGLLTRDPWIMDRFAEWFISYKTVTPDNFIAILDNKGKVLWERETNA